MKQIKVAAFTKGLNTPSARYRIRQLIPYLEQNGIEAREFPALFSSYPRSRKLLLPAMGLAALAARIPDVIKSYRYDISVLQRELLSTITTLEPLLKQPIVLDVDDAIFLRRGGKAARRLARLADHVICGNDFIAEHFGQWNSSISIIPTAVDTQRYVPVELPDYEKKKKVIGWIGTKGNFKYLYELAPVLEKIVNLQPDLRLKIIADQCPDFSGKLVQHLDYVHWHPDHDVKEIQSMTVGIMPLSNGDWERGKCSYKMLQYMSCGIPVVVSPVGMNSQVLAMGEVGIGVATEQEWIEGILHLINDPDLAHAMGDKGRKVVKEYFSIEKISSKVSKVLMNLQ